MHAGERAQGPTSSQRARARLSLASNLLLILIFSHLTVVKTSFLQASTPNQWAQSPAVIGTQLSAPPEGSRSLCLHARAQTLALQLRGTSGKLVNLSVAQFLHVENGMETELL